MATPKAPEGGFKQGGWYDGRQYWNGTFSDPGVIHASSDQVGAGKAVSQEVVAQTNPNNVQYINEQRQNQGLSPAYNMNTPQEVNSYLNDFGSNLFQNATAVETRSFDSIKESIAPGTARPEVPNYVELFETARTEAGVQGLEQNLNQLKAEQDQILATRQERVQQEEGKPVAAGVMAGRIGEIEKQENTRLAEVQRAAARLTDQLNTAYSGIQLMMSLNEMTYEAASGAWNDEFNQNMAIYGVYQDERQFATDERRYEQQLATANLQTMTNLLTSGNMTYGQFSQDQKLQLSKLSVQAGFPPDFLASVQVSPKDKMLFASQETGQVAFMGADGTINVQNIPGFIKPKSGSGSGNMSESELSRTAFSEMESLLSMSANSYGHIHPNDWSKLLSEWRGAGLPEDEFVKQFKRYADPNREDFDQVYFSREEYDVY